MKNKILLILLMVICLFTFTGCNRSNKLKEGKDYYIRSEFTGKYLDIKKRGYYIDTLNEPDAPYLYIICMGEHTTGGYALKIKEVIKNDENVEVIVEEIIPKAGQNVTMEITHPTIIVEFPKYQENLIIKNTKGEIFDRLN